MKISLRILLINFLIVVLILGSSFFVFYNIVYDVLTSSQTRNLRQSANNFTYVYRSLQTETEEDFLYLYNKGIESSWKEQRIQSKNVDFVLELNEKKNDLITQYLVKPFIYLPEKEFNLKEFQSINPYLMIMSFSAPDGRKFLFGRAINSDLLNNISQRINSEIALIWDGYPADVSNQGVNQRYLYVLSQAVDNLKNKNNFELFVQGTESKDILATIYKPSNLAGSENISFLVFNTFAEAGELRSTLKDVFIIIGIVGIALSMIFIMVFTDKLRKQLTALSKATEQTYTGKLDSKIEIKSNDEIGKLGMAFNKMLDELKKKEIAKNEYAEFITLINQNPSLEEISDVALKKIIDAGDFIIGGLYNVDDKIELISAYGLNAGDAERYEKTMFFKKVLENRESLELYDENTLPVISTGLVDIRIKYLLFLPIIYNNKPIALLELGSLIKPREEVRDYLDKIKDQLAIGITNARALQQLEKLVTELKQLNDEYQKQNVQIKEQNETLLMLHNELKVQAEELEKQKRKAIELTDAKSKFLASMSHELRTPMNSILGLTELMLEKVDEESRNKERLEVVLNSGKRLMTLINDILDLSKIEAGKIEIIYEDVLLDEIIDEVSGAILPLAHEKGINYEIIRSIDTHSVVNTDRGKVVQVLINLLGNAVKYTDKGKVSLKVSAGNEMLNFDVIDTGIGIAEEEMDLIFEEFAQAHNSKSKRNGGTGLGLAISKKLAEILGGSLTVKSQLNQGSAFTFSVPFNQVEVFLSEDSISQKDNSLNQDTDDIMLNPEQQTSDITGTVSEWFDEQKLTEYSDSEIANRNENAYNELRMNKSNTDQHSDLDVLIVDDDSSTLFTLSEIVKSINCNPILANSGKECLELLETKIPDLILLDIIMPEMDGFKTIKQIKRNSKWADIPVFAVTAKAMKNDNEIILRHGFSDYIPKPVNPAFVSYKIQSIFSRLKTT